MSDVDEGIRSSAERLLHEFWNRDDGAKACISGLLDMQLKGISLRSGRKTGRVDKSASSGESEKFLVWQAILEDSAGRVVDAASIKSSRSRASVNEKVVGACVLQCKASRTRTKKGGAVIEYIAVSRLRGGKGWPLVCAAEQIVRDLGLSSMYSAADMSHDGRYADLTASPGLKPADGRTERSAMAAHHRWGFRESSKEEWKALGLTEYDDRRCTVHYMKKTLD